MNIFKRLASYCVTSYANRLYDKAVKLYGEDIDISAFRYEGPRPRSKEAAVVMLDDTIEAATRTLANPSPERMEQLDYFISVSAKYPPGPGTV